MYFIRQPEYVDELMQAVVERRLTHPTHKDASYTDTSIPPPLMSIDKVAKSEAVAKHRSRFI